jgi:hypothetical protein
MPSGEGRIGGREEGGGGKEEEEKDKSQIRANDFIYLFRRPCELSSPTAELQKYILLVPSVSLKNVPGKKAASGRENDAAKRGE